MSTMGDNTKDFLENIGTTIKLKLTKHLDTPLNWTDEKFSLMFASYKMTN